MAWWNRFTDLVKATAPALDNEQVKPWPELSPMTERQLLMEDDKELIKTLWLLGFTDIVLRCIDQRSFWYGSEAKLIACSSNTMLLGVMCPGEYHLEKVTTWAPGHLAEALPKTWEIVDREHLIDQALSLAPADSQAANDRLRRLNELAKEHQELFPLTEGLSFCYGIEDLDFGETLFIQGYFFKDAPCPPRHVDGVDRNERTLLIRLVDHPRYSTDQAFAATRQKVEEERQSRAIEVADKIRLAYSIAKDRISSVKDGDILTPITEPGPRWVVISQNTGERVVNGVLCDVLAMSVEHPGVVDPLCSFQHTVVGNIEDFKDGELPYA